MSAREPTGVSPTSPRSAVRVAGEFVAVRVRAADGEVMVMTEPVMYDPDAWLTGPQCARLLGVKSSTWRSLVASGYAPKADDPDEDRPPSVRMPRWKAATFAEFRRNRPGRTGRPPKERPDGDQG